MSAAIATPVQSARAAAEVAGQWQDVVHRTAASITLAKSPRLRAFFLHVCRCALEDRPEEATEQQIGIFVYGRSPGYNPNEDNIVRSQARVLRMKLEHHFANEGREEPVVITIPKGKYLPSFEHRAANPPAQIETPAVAERKPSRLRWMLAGAAVLCSVIGLWAGYSKLRSISNSAFVTASQLSLLPAKHQPEAAEEAGYPLVTTEVGEIRIAAGYLGRPFVDAWGERWESDRYYQGGIIRQGPTHFFPPVANEARFRSIREAASGDLRRPQGERGFQYDIPLSPGVYELRLYFADPLRQPDADQKEDAQNLRHFQVELNGHPLFVDLDPIADAGAAPVDVRVFKDVRPSEDGRLHLEFTSHWGQPAFVSALELTRGLPGKLKPIRISARPSDFTDAEGMRWSGDRYFIDGRTWTEPSNRNVPRIPPLYAAERHGNFSYAIPVTPGTYTVRLHFLESFFSSLVPDAYCHGAGCRVFDVTCNGVMLLQDFDVFQAAGGAFRPVVKEFHGLHPNGQGKLLLSFSPKANYAEVRAIEVIDEGK